MKGFMAKEKHWNYGNKWSDEVKDKMSKNRKGLTANENHPAWKGDLVGYRALHDWVDNNLGKPQHCSLCNDISKHRYHWANFSGRYLRIKSDWIRLCPKCHKRFDKNKQKTSEIFVFSHTSYNRRRIQCA